MECRSLIKCAELNKQVLEVARKCLYAGYMKVAAAINFSTSKYARAVGPGRLHNCFICWFIPVHKSDLLLLCILMYVMVCIFGDAGEPMVSRPGVIK